MGFRFQSWDLKVLCLTRPQDVMPPEPSIMCTSYKKIRLDTSGGSRKGIHPQTGAEQRLGREDLLPHRERSRWRSDARKMLCKLKVTHPLRRPKSGLPIFFLLDKTETTDKVRLNRFNF